MPENKRIKDTGLVAGDVFMLEGTLKRINTKQPFASTYDPNKLDFTVALTRSANDPINVFVPTNLSDADKQRVSAGAQRYIENAAKADKNIAGVSTIYLSKRARFPQGVSVNFTDYKAVREAVDPKSMIPTFRADANDVYHVYTGNDPVRDSHPRVRVIINLYEYTKPTPGVTDGIEAVLYPAEMEVFGSGNGRNLAATLENFGVKVDGGSMANTVAQAATEASAQFQANAFEQVTPVAQPTSQPEPTAAPTAPFGNAQAATPFGTPAQGNAQSSPFMPNGADPFKTSNTPF